MTRIKKIEGFSDYSITDSGKVLSEYKGNFKWLKPGKYRGGYLQVILRNGGKTYAKKVHRLVAEAHIPNIDNKPCVDHINGVRTDNRVENLRWCTHQENMSFPLVRKNMSEAKKGHPKYEGAGKQPRAVIQFTKDGEFVAKYESLNEAARRTCINCGSISMACNRHYKSAGGYKWAYLN